jgi:AcrR family transcriptional regulator
VKAATRSYTSPRREKQADETRRRIGDSARVLIAQKGYDATTIADIAQEAGVCVQTVYAVFGSKQGILAGLIERAIFGLQYDKLIAEAFSEESPADRLRYAAKIACEIYESERIELDFLRAAGVQTPELAIDKKREGNRFAAQTVMIDSLVSDLRPGLTPAQAHDILWTLTARESYRLMVVERGWSASEYEDWLGSALVREILAPLNLSA